MKILINCVNLLTSKQGAGGAGQYVYHLLKELASLQEVRVLTNVRNFSDLSVIPNLKLVPLVSNEISNVHHYFSWCDIYLCPLNELVPEFVSSTKPVVATILDVQHEVLPHFFKGGVYEQRHIHYSYAINRSDSIITISEAERSLIQKLYDKNSVYVTYLAGYLSRSFKDEVGTLPNPLENFEYLLYPAIPWRHKNHCRLIEAFWILKTRESRFKSFKLVLTGATHELSSGAVSSLIRELNLTDDIMITGHVSNEELVALLKGASVMVFPSLYEGFGIPVVDAMEFGVPVIASPLPAISEICSSNIAYFKNPYDSIAISEDILEFFSDANQKNNQTRVQQAIEFSKQYSPKQTALKTIEVLERTIEAHNRKFDIQRKKLDSQNISSTFLSSDTQLTLIIDLNLLSEKHSIDCSQVLELFSAQIKHQRENLYKVVFLFPRESFLENSSLLKKNDFNQTYYKRVFYRVNSSSSYFRAYSYMFDSVVDTQFFLIVSTLNDLSQVIDCAFNAMSTLEFRDDLSAIKILRDSIDTSLILPLTGIDLINTYEANKLSRVSFFSDMLLRATSQGLDSYVGTYQYLNNFLANAKYIKTSLSL
ncbi:glycosyltransferase family 4 protein [Leptothoe kymatousa]|uniref:Glycosyltransferase family 4 protein n=1 Tax=Leptothoe kymatousa TAU-MAC 1615 TaxID=2364775 RepID=A0ABS5Y7T1_9CYAN|nr:glycosyltransferase family 1 protein [Leptothoe kymatousa]MBT9313000.1 glycosyltransferase family 4 protein [Leptothoe kymatousa TAU-MAC 1615]